MSGFNHKMAVSDAAGGWRLRVFHKKGKGRQEPRYLVKCGCCDQSVEIFYGPDGLEINGVNASIVEWRRILGPLLSDPTEEKPGHGESAGTA